MSHTALNISCLWLFIITPVGLHGHDVLYLTHLLPLLELREHYNRVTFPLPHHSPEILHCVKQRALCGNEVVFLPVALG